MNHYRGIEAVFDTVALNCSGDLRLAIMNRPGSDRDGIINVSGSHSTAIHEHA